MKRISLLFSLLFCSILFLQNAAQAQVPGIPNKWQSIKSLDTGVVYASAFSIGTKAYVIGGDTADWIGINKYYSKALWEYDSTTNTWTRKANFPGTARIGAVAFSINGKGYYGLGDDTTNYLENTIIGGTPVDYYKRGYKRDWWEYNPATNTWTQKADFAGTARAYSSGVSVNSKGYVFFGVDTIFNPILNTSISQYNGSMWEYDPASNAWSLKASIPRNGRANAVSMVLEGKIYTGMGTNGEFNKFYDDWWEYNPATDIWTEKSTFPSTGRQDAGAINFSFLGYMINGYDGTWKREMWEYNSRSNSWQRFPDFKDSARAYGVSWTIGQMGYTGAGFRGNSETHKNIAKWLIDTNTIVITSNFADTLCAGDQLTFRYSTGIDFEPSNKKYIQLSDDKGNFDYPPKPNYILDSLINDTALNGQMTVRLPFNMPPGVKYRIRMNTTMPYYLGSASDTFFMKQNPTIVHYPAIIPLIDTICLGGNKTILINAGGTAFNTGGNLQFQWRKDGVALSDGAHYSGTHNDTLTILDATNTQGGNYNVIVKGDCYPDTSLTFKISIATIPPPTVISIPNDTVVCEFTPLKLKVRANGSHVNYQWFLNGDTIQAGANVSGTTSSELNIQAFGVTDSGYYKVKVFEDCGASVTTDSFYIYHRQIPRIVSQPVNIFPAVPEGAQVQFNVVATGYNLTYQWRRGITSLTNNARITGATTPNLTINPVKLTDVEFFSVVVSGGCGIPDTSTLAMLSVKSTPQIKREPEANIEICENGSTNISVIADGANLIYQWKKAGVNLTNVAPYSGVNTRILEITNAQLADAGTYTCEVSNDIGTSTSQPSVLVINPKPAKPTVIKIGVDILQCLEATPATGDLYTWFFNGRYEPAYNSKSIQVPGAKQGDYTCRITRKGCVSPLSDPYAYFLTSVLEAKSGKQSIFMYPNPAHESVVVELPDEAQTAGANIIVTDMLGKQVINLNNQNGFESVLDLSGMKPGIYMVNVLINNTLYSGKLIKNR